VPVSVKVTFANTGLDAVTVTVFAVLDSVYVVLANPWLSVITEEALKLSFWPPSLKVTVALKLRPRNMRLPHSPAAEWATP